MTRPPRLFKIGFGNQGIAESIEVMWQLALGGSLDVRLQAEQILREANAHFLPSVFQAGAIYDWVQRHMAYVGDNVLVEEIRSPQSMLETIRDEGSAMGDCDDFVILLAALFASIGLPIEMVTTSDRDDGEWTHIFLVVDTSAGLMAADAITGQPFGWHVDDNEITALERWPMPMSLEEIGVEMVG